MQKVIFTIEGQDTQMTFEPAINGAKPSVETDIARLIGAAVTRLLKPKEKSVLLVHIANNVVNQVMRFKESGEVNAAFIAKAREMGVKALDADLDNGYIELPNGDSLCITWIDVD